MPQGTPGVKDFRNPTLLPQYNKGRVQNGVFAQLSPAELLNASPRVAGSATATIGGTVAENDTAKVTLTHACLPGGKLEKTITADADDAAADVAEKLATAFNDDATAQAYGIYCTVAGAVVTFKWLGPLSLVAAVTKAQTGTTTVTLSGATMTGGSGPVIPIQNFTLALNGSLINFWAEQPVEANYQLVKALADNAAPVR